MGRIGALGSQAGLGHFLLVWYIRWSIQEIFRIPSVSFHISVLAFVTLHRGFFYNLLTVNTLHVKELLHLFAGDVTVLWQLSLRFQSFPVSLLHLTRAFWEFTLALAVVSSLVLGLDASWFVFLCQRGQTYGWHYCILTGKKQLDSIFTLTRNNVGH